MGLYNDSFNNNIPVTNGIYHEWEKEPFFLKEAYLTFDKIKIDIFSTPPIDFLYGLCSRAKKILVNDEKYLKYFNSEFLAENKKFLHEYETWNF